MVGPASGSAPAGPAEEGGWVGLACPALSEAGIGAAAESLRSGWLSMGAAVEAFEAMLVGLTGAGHAVMTSSCTSATEVALRGLGVGAGDEVIVPSFTWPSVVAAVCACGAVPVAADVSPETLMLSPAGVARRVTLRTRAVIVVDYAGVPADIAALRAALPVAVAIVEDAAHAFGSRLHGRFAGTAADARLYSFGATKTFALGEGGAVVTGDRGLAERCRALRNTGVTRTSWDKHRARSCEHDIVGVGLNAKPVEAVAALGVAEAARLPATFAGRAWNWQRLRAALDGIAALQEVPAGAEVVPYLFPLLAPTPTARDDAYAALRAQRVEAGKHYPPLHRFPGLAPWLKAPGPLPVTEDVAARTLTLPCHQGLTPADIDRVADAVTASLTGPVRSVAPALQHTTLKGTRT